MLSSQPQSSAFKATSIRCAVTSESQVSMLLDSQVSRALGVKSSVVQLHVYEARERLVS